MKRLNCFLLAICLVAIFTLASCDINPYKTAEPKGKATISIATNIEDSSNSSGGTNQSTTTLFIKEYKITATGPNGTKIDKTVEAEEVEKAAVSYDSLTIGNWKIEVEALNYNGVIVGKGSSSIQIEEDKENTATISVNEQAGEGKLLVQIQYPGQYTTDAESKELSLKLSSKDISLDRVGKNGNDYYYTLMDLENGFYNIQITDKSNNEIYSGDIRVVNDAITSITASVDKNNAISKKAIIINLPELSFDADNYVAQNCSNYFMQFFYDTHDNGESIYSDIICFGLDCDNKPLYNDTTQKHLSVDIKDKNLTIGKHKLTLNLKVGNVNKNTTLCSKDFYFEVTKPVEEDTLNNLIINALPENFLCGNQTESDYPSYVDFLLSANGTKATLHDNTPVTFNTDKGKFITIQSDYQLTSSETTYNIVGNIDITHDKITSKYQIDSLDFDATLSYNGLCASNISGNNILKDDKDISKNQAELEKLVSYFIALLECDGNGLTFTNINRQINDKYVFENYKSGNYSIDGFINYRKSYNSFEETSYLANIENSELTFKDGNDIYHLKFGINYKVEGTQQDPNTIKLTYSDFSINNISLNNISNSSLKLSVEALTRIKQFVLYFEK